MNNLWRKGLAVVTALVMVLLPVGCVEKEEMDRVTVCEVTHSIFYAPQYVAITQGFFEQQGIVGSEPSVP